MGTFKVDVEGGAQVGLGGAKLAGVAGLTSPTAGCVDTTEWPLERELGQCVEGERLGGLPVTGPWATDCGCLLLLLLLLVVPCSRNWAEGPLPRASSRETQVRKHCAFWSA